MIQNPVSGDTVYLKHGDKMEGRIVQIDRDETGIQSIRIKVGGAYVTVPGEMIDRYDDVLEATDTPTPAPTFTPTATSTRRPTSTPTPVPTPTPYAAPPRPPAPVSGAEQPSPTPTEYEEVVWEGDWDEESALPPELQDAPIPDFLRRRLEQYATGQTSATGMILSIIQAIAYLTAWIMCVVDGFRKGAGTGILLLIFGSPCCGACCVGILVLIFYSSRGYEGDAKNFVQSLVLAVIVLNIVLLFLG